MKFACKHIEDDTPTPPPPTYCLDGWYGFQVEAYKYNHQSRRAIDGKSSSYHKWGIYLFFCGHSRVAGGYLKLKKFDFFQIFSFFSTLFFSHGQRRALYKSLFYIKFC